MCGHPHAFVCCSIVCKWINASCDRSVLRLTDYHWGFLHVEPSQTSFSRNQPKGQRLVSLQNEPQQKQGALNFNNTQPSRVPSAWLSCPRMTRTVTQMRWTSLTTTSLRMPPEQDPTLRMLATTPAKKVQQSAGVGRPLGSS